MSRAMRDQTAAVPHLSKHEIADLRSDVDAAFGVVEGRPVLTRITGGSTAISLAALPVAKTLVGIGLLAGQTKATRTKGTGTASLAFTANRPGTPGNAISVVITQGAGALVVSAVGNVATIELAAAGSTANAVKAAWDAEATTKILAQVVSGGAGTVLVSAVQNLAGGLGDGLSVKVNGIEQEVAGAASDTSIPMLVTTLTGAANLDQAQIKVTTDGLELASMQIAIAT